MKSDAIELLSPGLIELHPEKVREIDRLCDALWKELGWHYLLDLIWILNQLERFNLQKGATILDAGAGAGLAQYLLAERGYNLISVDYTPPPFPIHLSLLYRFRRLEGEKQLEETQYSDHVVRQRRFGTQIRRYRLKVACKRFALLTFMGMFLGRVTGQRRPGMISLCRADMKNMREVPTGSVDAVISVSAVEHLETGGIQDAVLEFERVLKEGAPMLVTTSAAREEDWFHEPSKGWCFSPGSLRKLFGVSGIPSFARSDYDVVMEAMRGSTELQNRLASSYFISGDTGMPWGKWDPQYLPVGVVKCKTNS